MPATLSVDSIMAQLKKKGSEKTRKIYSRHGMTTDNMYGVSVADLKVIAKKIKGQQSLALQLYDTGNVDAMYLAGMVADGAQMTPKQLSAWADAAVNRQMISEYTVPWVAVEHSNGRELALEWMKSSKEHVAAAGWCTYSGLLATKPDEELSISEIKSLLQTVVKDVARAKNRVRYAMNGFVISVGAYIKPLLKEAKAAAREIGDVSVDVGETACSVPVAIEYISKIEKLGRIGKKRKTMRC
ncbi:MAG TPA: DNA alkylation repair protein [Candidatus Acidoferrum sp.]|nr:DNA alkylation repair protein [Candidatus Acidoferrum sp.]